MSAGGDRPSGVGAPIGNNNAVGNLGGGAPLGNSNAVGNTGGGAPEENTNRRSHGVYCSLEKIDKRAEGEVAEFIDSLEAVIRERATGDPGEVAREIPLRVIRFDRAVQDIQSRGFTLDDDTENPMVSKSRRVLSSIFDDLREIGVL